MLKPNSDFSFGSIGVNGHLDRSNFSRVKYWKSDWDIKKKNKVNK